MLRFDRFDALTFDCYGTLIDWERGLLAALRPVLERHGAECADERLLALFAAAEQEIEAGPYRLYNEVLGEVMERIGSALGFAPDAAERDALSASIAVWPTFPDTLEALDVLKGRFRLAIVSNVDDALFAGSASLLGVTFDQVITAEQVRSYKPAPAHFEAALQRLALPVERVLHVAQSRFHDIAPAKALGFSTVWVNRRAGRPGSGATPEDGTVPDLEVPDLLTLARAPSTAPRAGPA